MGRSTLSSPRRWIAVTSTLLIFVSWILTGFERVDAGVQRPAITLLSQGSFVSAVEGSTFQISLLLSEPLVDAIDPTTRLVLTAHRPVSSRADVRSAIEGDLPQIIDAVGFPLKELVDRPSMFDRPTDGATRLDITVPTEIGRRTSGALQMSATGVYPLTIDVERAGERIVRLISFLERLGPDSLTSSKTQPLDVALVGRLGPPPSFDREVGTVVSNESRTVMTEWVSLLERRPGFAATIAIQPEFLDAFARSIPEDKELLIRLQRSATFDFMSTTYVAMDPSDADRHGLTDVFTRQLRLGEATLGSLFPTRVTPRGSWLDSSTMTSGGARVLADLGFRSAVLVPSAHDIPDPDPTRLVELSFAGEGSIMGALVDNRLAELLDVGSSHPVGGEHLVAQQVLAELKLLRSEISAQGRSPSDNAIVLATETGELPSPAMSDALWEVTNRDPRFVLTNLNMALMKMFSRVDVDRFELSDTNDQPSPFPASAALGATLQSLTSTVDAFSTVLPEGDERVRTWEHVIDVLPDNRLTASDRQSLLESVRFSALQIASSVIPPASTTFTLGGRDSPIRFSVRNDGATDLDILIRMTSPKLRLPEGDKVVTLPAGTSTAVEFAVSARSNGRFPVTLQLLTPRGDVPLGPPSTLTARVNALAGLGQLVSGIALLLLATWWANHFRQQYRRRQSETDLSSRRHPSGEGSA